MHAGPSEWCGRKVTAGVRILVDALGHDRLRARTMVTSNFEREARFHPASGGDFPTAQAWFESVLDTAAGDVGGLGVALVLVDRSAVALGEAAERFNLDLAKLSKDRNLAVGVIV